APETTNTRARLAAARGRVEQRLSRMAGATEADAVAWDGQTRGQLEIAGSALQGVRLAAGLAAEYRTSPDIYGLISSSAEGYVGAAEISDLYPAARARLDAAERRAVLFPATALELFLTQIRRMLDDARRSRTTAVQTDPGTQYGVNEMDRQEQELRIRL